MAEAFNLPPDLDFNCTNCGRCCRDRWEIRVDAGSAERLNGRYPGEPFKKRLAVVPDELPFTVERNSCGACVFLEEKNLCRIHRELGLEAKPQVCQQFPFLFSEHPDGVTVGLSHYCPGVKRVEGAKEPPLQGKLPELERLRAHALRLEKAGREVLLEDGVPLAWADYRGFEDFLLELIRSPTVNAAEALVAAALAASMLSDFLRTRPGKPPLGAAREFVAGWRRMGIARILATAGRQRAKPRTGRLLLRQFLSLVDAGAGYSASWAFFKELVGRGKIFSVPLEARVSVRGARAVELPWDQAEPLRRYAEHAVFRRRLLPKLGVRVGLALLCLHVASARSIARASAWLAGRARTDAEDVARGVQLVEKHYALHSSLPEVFVRGPARTLFQRVSARPRYAWAVLTA
jgi:Fe-S-cluster containining protein